MKKFKKIFLKSVWICLLIELVEEVLEELIAFCISGILIKWLSIFLGITLSIATKTLIKIIAKQIIYKEGHDKLEKLKTALSWLNANKFSLMGTASAVVAGLGGTGVIPVDELPAILIAGFNITPIIYYLLFGILSILGVSKQGWEKIAQYTERIAAQKEANEAKAIEKQARKEIKAEEKLANQTQAEQAKVKEKLEAEALARAEQEKADAEYRAKVEEIKQKLLAEKEQEKNNN